MYNYRQPQYNPYIPQQQGQQQQYQTAGSTSYQATAYAVQGGQRGGVSSAKKVTQSSSSKVTGASTNASTTSGQPNTGSIDDVDYNAKAGLPPAKRFVNKITNSEAWLADTKDRVQRIVKLFNELQRSMNSERSDIENCVKTFNDAVQMHGDLEKELDSTRDEIDSRNKTCQYVQHTLRCFQGEDLEHHTQEEIECIADKLSAAIQKVLIGQTSTGSSTTTSSTNISTDQNGGNPLASPFLDEDLKTDRRFDVALLPPKSEKCGMSSEICAELIQELSILQSQQSEKYTELTQNWTTLEVVQSEIWSMISRYKTNRDDLRNVTIDLRSSELTLNRLSGEADLSSMNNDELRKLHSEIQKYQRKVTLQLAMRLLKSQQESGVTTSGGSARTVTNLPAADEVICVVCFERPWNTLLAPCGHVLCDTCARRLNFCPHCRQQIQARQSIHMP